MPMWIQKFLVFMLTLLLVGLSGCETLEKVDTDSAALRVTVKAGVLRYIEAEDNRAERAQRVQEVVEKARAYVDTNAETTAGALADYVRSEISWDRLELSEKLVLQEVITAVQDRLEERIGDGSLDEDARLKVVTVLDWAWEASAMYAQEGRVHAYRPDSRVQRL